MQTPEITAVGFTVVKGEHVGTFDLTFWSRCAGEAVAARVDYGRLSYTELVDVLLAELDGHRPGYQLLEGAWQPQLWD